MTRGKVEILKEATWHFSFVLLETRVDPCYARVGLCCWVVQPYQWVWMGQTAALLHKRQS